MADILTIINTTIKIYRIFIYFECIWNIGEGVLVGN